MQKTHGQDAPRARTSDPVEWLANGAPCDVLDGHEYFDGHQTSDASTIKAQDLQMEIWKHEVNNKW